MGTVTKVHHAIRFGPCQACETKNVECTLAGLYGNDENGKLQLRR